MRYGFYKFLTDIIYTFGFPPFYLYSWITGNHKDSIRERLGYYDNMPRFNPGQQHIWIHAASVGEVRAVQALYPELRFFLPDIPCFLSTVTEHGHQVALDQLGAYLKCVYAPIDVNCVVKRALSRLKPTCYICLETELWPNLLTEAYRSGVKLLLLNGRISERSLNRYRKVPGLVKPLMQSFTAISAISETDRERFMQLGADPAKIFVAGNVKYDLQLPISLNYAEVYRTRLGLSEDQPVFIFGSTHTGEEQVFIDSFFRLRDNKKNSVFIIAPRHLNRLAEIEKLFISHNLPYEKLSRLYSGNRQERVILVDTMGELALLYSIGTFVFCGGSLVPKGGHNIMEAAIWGKPVYYGPHMKDFADAVTILESGGAGFLITGSEDLIRSATRLMQSPEQYHAICLKAREAALAQQGAARRQAELVKHILFQ